MLALKGLIGLHRTIQLQLLQRYCLGHRLGLPTFRKLRSWHLVPSQWEIEGETVSDFILRGSKITADGDCSHEIKRCLLLGRKVMTNLDSIL